MPVSVIEVVQSGLSLGTDTTVSATTTVTPEAGDVVVVVYRSVRAASARLASSISGMGATFTQRYQENQGSLWTGSGATAAGTITVTQNAAGTAQIAVYLVRGLTATTTVGRWGGGSVATDLGHEELPAGAGQIAFAWAYGQDATLGAITYPNTQTPATGWTFEAAQSNATEYARTGYRVPTESAVYNRVTIIGASGDSKGVWMAVVGDPVASNAQVEGVYAEALTLPTPAAQVEGVYAEVLAPTRPTVEMPISVGLSATAEAVPSGPTPPTVVEHVSAHGSSQFPVVTLTQTPQAGDVVVVYAVSLRATSRQVTAVSGLGAAWTQKYATTGNGRISYWVGTGATASGNVTVSYNGTNSCYQGAFILRGLTSTDAVGAEVVSNGTFNGPSQQAGAGQFVVAVGANTGATGAELPALAGAAPTTGWVNSPQGYDAKAIYRVPTGAATAHQVSAAPPGETIVLAQATFGVTATSTPTTTSSLPISMGLSAVATPATTSSLPISVGMSAAARTKGPGYANEVLWDDPVGYWRLGEELPQLVDSGSAGAGTDWRARGGVSSGLTPLVSDGGKAMASTGSGIAVSYAIPAAIAGKDTTMEAWFTMPAGSVGGMVAKIGDSGAGGSGWGFGIGGTTLDNTGTQLIFLMENVAWVPTGVTVTAGTHHVVATLTSANVLTVRMDGAQVYSATVGSAPTAIKRMTVGGDTIRSLPSTVVVDNVAFYGTVLSAARADAHYNAGAGSNTAVAADTPVVWLKLDDTVTAVTQFVDASGNGRHLPLLGAPVSTTSKPALGDDALSITGTYNSGSAWARTSANPTWLATPSAFTAEAWVRTTATSGTIMARDNANGGGQPNRMFSMGLNGAGKLSAEVFANSYTVITSAGTINDNQWHHVALRYDGANATLYVDGVQAGQTAATGVLNGTNAGFHIGAQYIDSTADRWFVGAIDEAAVYSTALPVSRIAARFDAAGYAGRVLADAPTGFWKLNETSGTTMADSSGNGRNGTYSGATLGQARLHPDSSGVAALGTATGQGIGSIPAASVPHTQALTVSFWVKFNNTDDVKGLVSRFGAGGIGWVVWQRAGRIGLTIIDSSGQQDKYGPTFAAGQTAHVAVIQETGDGRVWLLVDGKDVLTSIVNGNYASLASVPLQIGGYDGSNHSRPTMSDVAYWDRALTTDDIHYHVNGGSKTVTAADPATLTGLAARYDAKAITGTADSAPVSSWADQSGNGKTLTNATSSTQPVYKTGIYNGHPVVRFDGVDDFLGCADVMALDDKATVFMVYRMRTLGSISVPWSLQNGNSGIAQAVNASGTRAMFNVGVWVPYTGGTMTAGVFERQVLLAREEWANNGSVLRVNGGIVQIYDRFNPGKDLRLAGSSTQGLPAAIDVAEVVVFNRPLTDREVRAVDLYLAQKWETPPSTPTTTSSLPISVGMPAAAQTVPRTTASLPISVGLSASTTPVATSSLPISVAMPAAASPLGSTTSALPISIAMPAAADIVGATTSDLPIAVGLEAQYAPILTTVGSLGIEVRLSARASIVGAAPGAPTGIRVWDGTSWVLRPVRVWDGSAWVARPVRHWTGTEWSEPG